MDDLTIDFDRYESALSGATINKYQFIPNLPVYQWNHSHGQGYWHESSVSRTLRLRSHPVHPLLGDLSPHSSTNHFTWKTILRPQDLPWIHDHKIQGQSVFPAAGYAATALETAPFLADGKPLELVEIEDLAIDQAMVFDNDSSDSNLEVQFSVTNIVRDHDAGRVTANFTYESRTGNEGFLELVASGRVCIIIGEPSIQTLPASNVESEAHMVNVPTDIFYSSLKDVGYRYTGPFKALSNLRRKLGKAIGSLITTIAQYDSGNSDLVVHPGMLDAAIHSIILAYSYPHDGKLWSLHLPTQIGKIRVNPRLCGRHWPDSIGDHVPFVATIPDDDLHASDRFSGFRGDVEIQAAGGGYTAIQIEGLHVVPFSRATQADDRQVFYATQWVKAEPNADVPGPFQATIEQKDLA
ncbi:polyketide synthase dehydratase-domain-containing protein [Delphinella strobiligena]|nr:polyketide synthase dehydratase-domain-containing protein [Delphinella strobiligena]